MELWRSGRGEVNTKEHWEQHLNSFWAPFEGAVRYKDMVTRIPRRPIDAWERYVKIVKLEKIS